MQQTKKNYVRMGILYFAGWIHHIRISSVKMHNILPLGIGLAVIIPVKPNGIEV